MTREGQSARMSRRALLSGAALAGGALAVPAGARQVFAAPALVRSGQPVLTHGVQSGDVGHSAGTVWTRADRPARMLVEVSADPVFRRARRIRGPLLAPEHDFTGTTMLPGLPAGRDSPLPGPRRTARRPLRRRAGGRHLPHRARAPRDLSFLWSGDIAGQGWGINRDRGGYRIFEEMRRLDPDFFLCSGDNIYADGPIQPTVTLPDGSMWRNVTTEEKSKVAETLAEFRGEFRYNLLDDNLRRFNAQVRRSAVGRPRGAQQLVPGRDPRRRPRTPRSASTCWPRAPGGRSRVLPDHPDNTTPTAGSTGCCATARCWTCSCWTCARTGTPTRRRPEHRRPQGILGTEQAAWLKRELAALPRGVEGHRRRHAARAWSCPTPPTHRGRRPGRSRARRSAASCRSPSCCGTSSTPRITGNGVADRRRALHRGAALRPGAGRVQGLRAVLGVRLRAAERGRVPGAGAGRHVRRRPVFVQAAARQNVSPATEYQFFGQVDIDAATRQFTVRLRDNSGTDLWSTTLDPAAR